MSDLAEATRDRRGLRPKAAALLRDQLQYGLVELWRSRAVLIFTFALPLVWLLVVGALAGNATVDGSGGLRVMQFVTPVAMSMGVLYAAYPTIATSVAEARERGVLKRLRGTPLPSWVYLAGRIGGAVVFALVSVAASVAVGVLAFGVHVIWRTVPATAVTLSVGIGCFAAIGLAVASLCPSQRTAQAASVGTAVALTFVSGLFTIGGGTPPWLQTVGDVLPLKPFTQSLQDQFNPLHGGTGWAPGRLAVVLGWGVAGALVAARAFRWTAGRRAPTGSHPTAAVPRPVVPDLSGATVQPASPRTPTVVSMLLDQARAANRSTWRDPGSVFFAVLMPAGLFEFMVATEGGGSAVLGESFGLRFAASMAVWGTAVTTFMNLPEAVVAARDQGVLKRLRGTPLRPWQYLAGRTAAALWLATLVTLLMLPLAALSYHHLPSVAGLLLGLAVLVLGVLTLAACGFTLAAAVSNARAVGAVGLLILLPLSFFSDIFVLGAPAWMRTVGAFFPLQHFQNALAQAWLPGGPTVPWTHLGVLMAWLVVTAPLAVRYFRWEPRETR